MALSPGARLGPDEITAAIGAGGMGEVFRARDTKLNRSGVTSRGVAHRVESASEHRIEEHPHRPDV